MDTYNNNEEIKVEETSIGPGERLKRKIRKISFYLYIISIILSFGLPLLFLDWFYKWKIWAKLELIKYIILKLKYSGKWQYISGTVKHHHFHLGVMLAFYFYIISLVLLLPYNLKIVKIIINKIYNSYLDTEAQYKDEIARRRNK